MADVKKVMAVRIKELGARLNLNEPIEVIQPSCSWNGVVRVHSHESVCIRTSPWIKYFF